jgi:hypothetical protein
MLPGGRWLTRGFPNLSTTAEKVDPGTGYGAAHLLCHNQGVHTMTEERIRTVEEPSGASHTHTTVITDGGNSGGAGKWVMLIALLVFAGLAYVMATQMGSAEITKDNAMQSAAESVEGAAGSANEAAEQVGDAISE